jgi:hypothetical protein
LRRAHSGGGRGGRPDTDGIGTALATGVRLALDPVS